MNDLKFNATTCESCRVKSLEMLIGDFISILLGVNELLFFDGSRMDYDYYMDKKNKILSGIYLNSECNFNRVFLTGLISNPTESSKLLIQKYRELYNALYDYIELERSEKDICNNTHQLEKESTELSSFKADIVYRRDMLNHGVKELRELFVLYAKEVEGQVV